MIPPPLKASHAIGIVSTARKITADEIQPAIDFLIENGFQIRMGATIGAEHFQFAGTDELRCNDFQQMLDDDSIGAVLFARGGYGTVRIIDEIDWRGFLRKPKWLCGFSDVTVIHQHLAAVYGVATAHSPMAINFSSATESSLVSFIGAISGEQPAYSLPRHPLNRNGIATGKLMGGNLSVMVSLLGSVSDPDTGGSILFLEDIDEHLYHVDRMMMALKRAGKFDRLAGMIVGHFTDMKNKDVENPFGVQALEIIAGSVREFDFPVCYGFPAGHEPDNRTLIPGAQWQLKAGDEVEVRMKEP